ncbi:uncharacterized protein LOC121382893 [Gigantopelta aegis]|uniref:uncharacterized protein LOC121382893 n=1 Tax=Gigantopelta aegis TaxID=1735272 RepID=UPI001B88C061|nr:uncharacterized protein LOC121382893 [Gigantopelta aegis]
MSTHARVGDSLRQQYAIGNQHNRRFQQTDEPCLQYNMGTGYVWDTELENDADKDFIIEGIRNGFRITDVGSTHKNVNCENYESATSNRLAVEAQINTELAEGNYVITSVKPIIELQQLLSDFFNKKRATKRQLQSLAGKLNFAGNVVRGGRTFLRRILDAISNMQQPHHKPVGRAVACSANNTSAFIIQSHVLFYSEFSPFTGDQVVLEEALDSELANFRASAFSDNTKKTYGTHRRAYYKFCCLLGYESVPASPVLVARYATFLARTLKFSSSKQYLNIIIQHTHKECGFPSPLQDNYILKTTLSGIKRQKGDAVSRKLPITPAILCQIYERLDMQCLDDAMFWAVCLTAFYALLQKSNLLPEKSEDFNQLRYPTRAAFTFYHWGAVMSLRLTKTIQFKERVLSIPLPYLPSHPVCAVSALMRAFSLANVPNSHAPAFLSHTSTRISPLLYSSFFGKLRKVLTDIGYPGYQYTGHSFRRGGATLALQAGLPTEWIKMLGDWKSDAYLAYVEVPFQSRLAAMTVLVKSLPLMP